MFFTTVCEYALRALTHLAAYGQGRPVQVREIAETEQIPRHFLAKILNQLTYKGLVRAMRGPGGGFSLVQAPDAIVVKDVIEAIDGIESLRRRCVLGLSECRDDQPCPMHESWKISREAFLSGIGSLTLASMAETMARKRDVSPARRS